MALLISDIANGIQFELQLPKTRNKNHVQLKMEELNYVTSI